MANLWREFQRLLPRERTIIVDVDANNGDGTSTVTTQTGSKLVVQGEDVAAGNQAFVKERAITGPAPALPSYTESV